MWRVFYNKIRCNTCGDIIKSDSDTVWTECTCGESAVMGKTFKKIKGKNITDMSKMDFANVPAHKGWDEKLEQKGE
jgi:hypothetical protein